MKISRSAPPAWLIAVATIAQFGVTWYYAQVAAAEGIRLGMSGIEIALAAAAAVLSAMSVTYLRVNDNEPPAWTYLRWTIFAYLQTSVGALVEHRVRADQDMLTAWLITGPLLGGAIAYNIRFWRAR